MLELQLDEYLKWAPRVADALHRAGRFLAEQCVFRAEDLPYRMQLPPLAAIRTVLGTDTDTEDARAKLARWCGTPSASSVPIWGKTNRRWQSRPERTRIPRTANPR